MSKSDGEWTRFTSRMVGGEGRNHAVFVQMSCSGPIHCRHAAGVFVAGLKEGLGGVRRVGAGLPFGDVVLLQLSRGTAARRDAGFTLIEQLVVIAVIAVSLAAIGSLMGSSSRGASRLEQRVSLLQATNNLLFDAMSSRDGLTNPRLDGAAWGHRWRMTLRPVQEDIGLELPENARWVPMREELVVQSLSGASMRLQTVHLQRIPGR